MRQSGNRQMAAGFFLLSLGLLVAAKWSPAPWHAIASGLLLTILVVKVGRALPDALRRTRRSRTLHGTWKHALPEFMPEDIRGMLRVELAIYREALCAILRRPRLSTRCMGRQTDGRRYTLHRGPTSSIFLPLVILGSLVELPLIHLLIQVKAAEALRAPFHTILAGLTIWGLLWAFGDRSAVRHIQHVVLREAIRLQVGFRASCHLPISAIRDIRRVSGRPRNWMADLGIDRGDVDILSPMDSPNLLISLTDSREYVRLTKFGRSVEAGRYIAVYVDDAASFQLAITESKLL